MRAILIIAGGALTLAGCQTAAESVPSVPPANYRHFVAAHMRTSLFDPYSVRDAEIAAPKRALGPSLNADGFNTPWVVCVRANAKNRFGAYTGRSVSAYAVSAAGVVNSWDEARYSQIVCAGADYGPFPEIEAAGKR